MRTLVLPCLLLPFAAAAQTATIPADGARPGNAIGTGQSLPRSNKASNATAGTAGSVVAPRLPTPSAGDDASPRGFLEAASRALTLGRTGEAQEALERAESRLLDRSVAPSRAGQPSQQALVTELQQARQALAADDRPRVQRLIGDVLNRLR